MAATKGEQVPWEESSLTGADFYFKSPKVAAAPAISEPVPAALEQETVFWQSIKDSDDPVMFEAYLRRFPEGTFSELAKVKRDALAKSTARLEAEDEARREAEAEAEIALWESIKESKDPADYLAYLGAYPDSGFSALARSRTDALRKATEHEAKRRAEKKRRIAEEKRRREDEKRRLAEERRAAELVEVDLGQVREP